MQDTASPNLPNPPDYTWLALAIAGFLGYQLMVTNSTLDATKADLKIYQSREQRTDQIVDKLRGFNRR